MPDDDAPNMVCRKCGRFQPRAEICVDCGAVTAKTTAACGAAVAGPPAAEDDPDSAAAPANGSRPLPPLARAGILVALLAVLAGSVFVLTPRAMSLPAFVAAKKASFNLRGFRIEGTVRSDRYPRIFVVQSGDGRKMKSLEIEQAGAHGFVTYDPERFDLHLAAGDRVEVSGSFKRIPSYGVGTRYKTSGIALASSITVLAAAPPAN